MIPGSSPFAHHGGSVTKVMLQVCLALIPCTLFGLYLYGLPSIILFVVTCTSAILTELLCLYWLKQPWTRILDGSALLTGWLLAITLPPWAPWWIGAVGAFFAIAIGKQLYGGIGQNIFNPAMLARTALLITFPVQMTAWVFPSPLMAEASPGLSDSFAIIFSSSTAFDGVSGATWLGEVKTGLSQELSAAEMIRSKVSFLDAFSGFQAGSLGESSELLVLLGAAFLLWRKIIRWEIPLAMLASLGLLSWLFFIVDSSHFADPLFHLTSGGVVLGAFFFATDPITSPISRTGKLLFGAGCGVLIYIIRTWGGFPEAVAFSILFMNAFTPLIDRYIRPRIYGRNRKGEPLPKLTSAELIREVQKRS